jgi:hypothetical protein
VYDAKCDSYARLVSDSLSLSRLERFSQVACAAEAAGEDVAAGEAWRGYRLVRDAARDPDELLAEGIALSERALEMARRHHT